MSTVASYSVNRTDRSLACSRAADSVYIRNLKKLRGQEVGTSRTIRYLMSGILPATVSVISSIIHTIRLFP